MENKKPSLAGLLISAKSRRFLKGIALPGIFRVMKFIYQWLIDHPQETYQAIKLMIEIWQRFRRRKRKSQEITPGSLGSLNEKTCLAVPIPGDAESPQTANTSVSAVQTKRLFVKKPKKKSTKSKKP